MSFLTLWLRAATDRDARAVDLLDRRGVLDPVPAAELYDRAVHSRKTEVVDDVEPELLPDRVLCGLDSRLVARSSAVVVELDSSFERARNHASRIVLVHSAQLHSGGKHEHVRSEAMPALMGREPDLAVAELAGEGPVHGGAAKRAACIACSVRADEDERFRHELPFALEIHLRQVFMAYELDPAHLR